MRIAIVDTLYPAFVQAHYRAQPQLRRASYEHQTAALLGRSFGTSDAYSSGFRAAGHEAYDLLVNCEELQLAWAAEHDRPRSARPLLHRLPDPAGRVGRDRFLRRIALDQLAHLEPDVIYFQDLTFLSPADLAGLRGRGAMLVAQLGSAPPGPDVLGSFDLIVTSFPHWVPRLRDLGVAAEYFPIAFDHRVVDRLAAQGISVDPSSPRPHRVAFVGGVHPPHVHRGGTAFLEHVVDDLDAEVWGYVADRVPRESPLLRRHGGEVWGLDMYAVLSRTQIALNRHGDVAEGYANNMRLFEASGVGAVVVTEEAPNLPELFTPGEEIVTYRDADDLVATVRSLLADDERRTAIAAAGQARTLREHTYARRIPQLADLISAHRD
jgi:hypothetical protein